MLLPKDVSHAKDIRAERDGCWQLHFETLLRPLLTPPVTDSATDSDI